MINNMSKFTKEIHLSPQGDRISISYLIILDEASYFGLRNICLVGVVGILVFLDRN